MKKIVSSVLLVSLLAGAVPAASSCAMPTRQGVSGFLRGVLSFFSKTDRAGATEEGRPSPEAVADSSYLATGRPSPEAVADSSYLATGRPSPEAVKNGSYLSTGRPSPEAVKNGSYLATGRPSPEAVKNGSYPAVGRPSLQDVEEGRYPATGRPSPEAVKNGSYLATRRNEKTSDNADANMRAKASRIKQDLYERFGYVRDGLLALQVAYAKNRHYTVRQKLERAMELNKYMEERLNRVYQDTLKGLEVDLDKEEKSMKESFDRSAFWVDNAARMFEHCQYTH